MKLKLIHIVYFLLVWFTLEDWALGFLPISETLYTLSRFGGELLIWATLAYSLSMRMLQGKRIITTPVDKFILLYILWVIVSSIWNLNHPIVTFQKERIFFRYIPVFYLLVNMETVNAATVRTTLRVVLGISFIQLALGIGQHFFLGEVTDFWLPRETSVEVGGVGKEFRADRGFKQGIILGTMTMPGQLATYLMSVAVFYVAILFYWRKKVYRTFFQKWRVPAILMLVLYAIGIFFTYSRASLILLIFAFPVAIALTQSFTRLVYYSVLGIVALGTLLPLYLVLTGGPQAAVDKARTDLTPMEEFSRIFSEEYITEEAAGNRLWMISDIGGTVIGRLNLIGYGSDETQMRENLYEDGVNSIVLTYRPIKDVYWVNILAHFGIIGLTLFFLVWLQNFKIAFWLFKRETDHIYKFFAYFVVILFIVLLFKTFFLSTFEYRPLNFTLWTFSGLLVNRYLSIKKGKVPEVEAA